MNCMVDYISRKKYQLFSLHAEICSMLNVIEEISLIMVIHIQRAYNYFGKVISNKEEKQNYIC